MILIVGLGNPGLKYKKTRHNLGFRVLDEFKKENSFPKFKFEKKFEAKISKGAFNSQKVILVKPQTFMNSSGKTVKALTHYYKIATQNIAVVHDDLDIKIGEIKISKERGSAGHKGVKSIIRELGAKNLTRLRVGIAPIGPKARDKTQNTKNFVLKKFTSQEKPLIEKAIKKTKEALTMIFKKTI